MARALSASLIRLCHLEVEWFSLQCPVAVIEPDLSIESHSFKDFSKTEELIEMGKSWTEAILQGEQGELLRSFSSDNQKG